eukprot:2740130-Rhodomonas_salina.1
MVPVYPRSPLCCYARATPCPVPALITITCCAGGGARVVAPPHAAPLEEGCDQLHADPAQDRNQDPRAVDSDATVL